MRVFRDLWTLASVLVFVTASDVWERRSFSQETIPMVTPVTILSEPMAVVPGGPISKRTLVQRPAQIKGLTSWTVESKRLRGAQFAMSLAPDGKRFAVGGNDGTLRIWNADEGTFERAMAGHDSYVYGIAWSPDGNTIATAGAYDTTAKLWDTRTGRLLRTLSHDAYVYRVAWGAGGTELMVGGGESGSVIFWNVTTGEKVGKFGLGNMIYGCSWSPDGRSLVFTGRTLLAQIMDASSRRVRDSIGDSNDDMLSASWSPDSRFLAASNVKATKIWDDQEKKVIHTLASPGGVVAWSPDGKTVAISTSGGQVALWDAATWKEIKKLPMYATLMAWSRDGSRLVSSLSTNTYVFDVAEGKLRHTLLTGGPYASAVWTKGGKGVLFGLGSKKIHHWELGPNKPLRTFDGHSAAVLAATMTSTGKVLATASADKTVRVWEAASQKELQKLEGHAAAVQCLAWGTNGKSLASGSADKSVKIWDASTGELQRTLDGHQDAVTVLAWGSKSLASGGKDSSTIVWNPNSGQQLKTIPIYTPVQSLAWTTDGSVIACGGSEQTCSVWNAANATILKRLDRAGSPPNVAALAFSNTSAVLASGRGNHTIQLWDMRTDKVLHDIRAFAPVNSVAWSSDGKTLVAGLTNRCVHSWDAVTGLLKATVIADDSRAAAVTAEGHIRMIPEDDESELVYVTLTSAGQETLSPTDFAQKYRWKNSPLLVKLTTD